MGGTADLAAAVVLCIIQALFFCSSHSLAPGNALSSQCFSEACSLSSQLPETLALESELSAVLLASLAFSLVDLWLLLANRRRKGLLKAERHALPASRHAFNLRHYCRHCIAKPGRQNLSKDLDETGSLPCR